jgi:pyroglutamyl-peptidase
VTPCDPDSEHGTLPEGVSLPRILVSGFEPFASHSINPTERLVAELQTSAGRTGETSLIPKGCDVRAVLLPVTFDEAFKRLEVEINDFAPHAVVAMGLARGRAEINIERVAINCLDAEVPDNNGYQPRDLTIEHEGPAAFFSTLPVRRLVTDLSEAKIPAVISNTAGTYVCNFLFYRLQALTLDTQCRTGFIHFPLLPEQVTPSAPNPSLAFEVQVRALGIILRTLSEEIAPYASRP